MVNAYELDKAKEVSIDFGIAACDSSNLEACEVAFSSKDDGNNKWNCLNRYGKENRTAQYCIDMDSSNRDAYNYKHLNKY